MFLPGYLRTPSTSKGAEMAEGDGSGGGGDGWIEVVVVVVVLKGVSEWRKRQVEGDGGRREGREGGDRD